MKTVKILGETIAPGETKILDMEIARLHTSTKLKVPVIVSRAKADGPTVLFSAGIHGDEINGVEIVRQLIYKKINQPKRGVIICIPIINMFGYVNQSRQFPDGRDLNRVFPGSKSGSLAGRFAYHLLKEIIPFVDYAIDFHAGGASRFNAAQIRVAPNDIELKSLADIFAAPFILSSKNIAGTFRNACAKKGVKMLLFEGGKSLDINPNIAEEGVNGSKRFLQHLDMLLPQFEQDVETRKSIYIEKSGWLRARYSGLLHDFNLLGTFVKKGTALGKITDPFGKTEHFIKAPNDGYIINSNHSPIVYQGDAVYHLSNVKNPNND